MLILPGWGKYTFKTVINLYKLLFSTWDPTVVPSFFLLQIALPTEILVDST
ncbi:hypothetical protein TOT_010001163 [Theileria orientalis strain Shintoku]|uniref:Uncharacterized protein n=1 Tax=Theileria orientalis strain Shintoku TaxID=869250 RepID=J4DNX3_THEOR|nr:hypothetical protein TOT_010001163 [Theileria orientalis strain Shintoku]PVC52477.1 hypothetical protein MACL_00000733 [Theileria orientalis]BAM39709.1 hypothetical protein TOT_010001163 [Theileria orientalis strain Shintoku]|eukprot:XP_009690010.1 hypothetical protein TOT_010001163 [Theileria orientalis strain Shintoku]